MASNMLKRFLANKVLVLLLVVSCATSWCGQASGTATDVREALLKSARHLDKEFPDGTNVLLTHFSYVGKLRTKSGPVFVANMRTVLANMNSPRGYNYLLFFDGNLHYLGKQSYVSSIPLWCEGGKLYLLGDLDGFSDRGKGNVIDLTNGFSELTIVHEKRYGSSGGANDD